MPIPMYGAIGPLANISALTGPYGLTPNVSVSVASAAWPTTNKIIYTPFRIPVPVLVTQLWHENGASVSGNYDIGLYNANGVRLAVKGSTAQATTSSIQKSDITDVLIGPGVYYIALNFDNTTATIARASPVVAMCRALGVLMEAAGALALPAVATFAIIDVAYIPSVGLLTTAPLV